MARLLFLVVILAAGLVPPVLAAPPDVSSPRSEKIRTHWAFQPIRRSALPAVKRPDWALNPVDAFVLARLERAGLAPAAVAERATLLRRATFDLTGLPPTPEELAAFLSDESPLAFERVVDRLLASPHYGERWGRHWLDVARYADSAGYEIDNFYDHAWLYRDYVIRSFNTDKPFDRFIHEQIAGDELWPNSAEAKLGTGFATVGPYAYEGGIGRPKVVEYQRLTDLADTTGSAFLGLTTGCARCHNHKFDPISQEDYFGLQAIFAPSKPSNFPVDKDSPKGASMSVLVNGDRAPETFVLRRGELDTPKDLALPAFLRSLPGGGVIEEKNKDDFKHRRTALARWLTATENPLTARVIANRVWQGHFGKGLVRTPNDFGTQGEPPTHPELLDWLASELRANGWSLKHLHRVIMTSAAYRMSARSDEAATRKDTDGRLLSRFPRRRLEAEAVWDNLHATAGTLNRTAFGSAVYPPIDKEVLGLKLNGKWESEKYRGQWTRRGVYMVVRRSLVLPFFESFNLTTPISSCACRDTTVVAPQALELLNGPLAVEQARAFAARLQRESDDGLEKIAERAWLLAFGRPITAEERTATLAFLRAAEARKGKSAALVELCLALFNANEFIYVD